ncbi:hypothetical protein IPM09_04660 [Candidatus Saccharibacteria bacterium]|nr:MAG: hypothetical protein IPM09_04660 [Candidatus Saccharibacteria bacterium]
METLTTIAHKVMTSVSLLTAFGVFMHDGRVDRAATTALHRPFDAVSTTDELVQRFRTVIESDTHTHPDHNAARNSLMSSFTYQSPTVPPRREAHHKYVLKQIEFGGRHAFDNANLPIVD